MNQQSPILPTLKACENNKRTIELSFIQPCVISEHLFFS